jgi:tRNA(fMet)-specific endonuclease VapC
MNGNFLLDTNIVIAVMNHEITKPDKAKKIFVPSIVIGELYFGAYKSQQVAKNLVQLNNFLIESVVLNCDALTAKCYGEIKNELRVKGKPIPENDIWIAAVAKQYSLTLVSRDSHFQEINDLNLEAW